MKNGIRLWLSLSIHVIIIMFVMVFITGTLSFQFFFIGYTQRHCPPVSAYIPADSSYTGICFPDSHRVKASSGSHPKPDRSSSKGC